MNTARSVGDLKRHVAIALRALTGRSGRRGAAMVEYAILLALIGLAVTVALRSVGSGIGRVFSTISATV